MTWTKRWRSGSPLDTAPGSETRPCNFLISRLSYRGAAQPSVLGCGPTHTSVQTKKDGETERDRGVVTVVVLVVVVVVDVLVSHTEALLSLPSCEAAVTA
jgi:hypothetical protein